MVIGIGNGEILRAVQQEVSSLREQLVSLSAQVAALAMQSATDAERAILAAAETDVMRQGLARAEAIISDQSIAQDRQSTEVEQLRLRLDEQDEAIKRLHGAFSRLEKQAAVDLDQVRKQNTDMAVILQGRAFTSNH